MSPSKALPPHTSFESIRKQAKKLARDFAAGDPKTLDRVHTQLPVPKLPFTLRDAQLILAREYGFAGWLDLRTAVLRQEGKGLEWAVAEAERLIHQSDGHDNNVDHLAQLLREYPALLSWRGDSGESLLAFATESFGDSGDPFREQAFTRIACAEFLLDAGATVDDAIWKDAIRARAKGVLQLLSRKNILPRTLETAAALGDDEAVRELLPAAGLAATTKAFLTACGFNNRTAAALLLDRCIELDPSLGKRVANLHGPTEFIAYLVEHPQRSENPWRTVVLNELYDAMHRRDLEVFNRWLEREPNLRDNLQPLVEIIQVASYTDRGPFITRVLEFAPAIKETRPSSSAVGFALEYGNAHLIPLLAPIWPVPDDLPHAAGIGDLARVKAWFDEAGQPKLGSLSRHHPTNNPSTLRNLHWIPANAQHVLDTALAWACMNANFEIAEFLLERGANIDTDWSTHEPASILHEVAIRGKYETAQFLIDHGIDLTICDYRWNGTARGWAIHASAVGQPPIGDTKMAELLAKAERDRQP